MRENYEVRIQELLGRMTLEEKVGQLQQCGPSLVGAFEVSFEELLNMMFDGKISEEEFGRLMSTAEQDFHEEDLRVGRIGSYNGVGDAETVNRLQKIAVEETRLGIPLIFGYDVIHGFRTVTPIPLGESCAWDPDLWECTGRMAAQEASAAGIHMTFAPMVDVAKDARWGRVSEGAGEDVLLNGCYGAAKVHGFQGEDLSHEDSIVACVKHFAAYGAAEAGRDYNRVDMSPQRLWEEYLPSYKACVEAGAMAVMPAFNDISGMPCSVNRWLLMDVLRKQWGFQGMTVSDANAIAECVDHGIATDRADAAAQAIHAGMDMDMTSNVYIENLAELVQDGTVDEAELDRAVADILRVKFALGLFDHPYQTSVVREKDTILKPEFRMLAREAAQKSIVLLKNEGNLLPLSENVKIGLAGNTALMDGEMTGAWAIGANGEDCVSLADGLAAAGAEIVSLMVDNEMDNLTEGAETSKSKNPIDGEAEAKADDFVTMTEGDAANLTADDDSKNRESNSRYVPDCEALPEAAGLAKNYEALTADCDVIIAAIGETKEQSGEAASRADITLPQEQIHMLECLLSTGKPVIAVLFNGRPLAIPYVAENVPVILEAWHPGVEAGNALADILFGKVNPSAKLTTTFPYTSGQCPMYYAHINTGRPGGKAKFTSRYLDTPVEPVYPFGYGLSYTAFAYSNLAVKETEDAVTVGVTVTNTGTRAGDEIAQCYFRRHTGRRVRPVKQLAAFEKISLEAGEVKTVIFRISREQMGYYDGEMNFITEGGRVTFFAGGNSVDCLEETIEV